MKYHTAKVGMRVKYKSDSPYYGNKYGRILRITHGDAGDVDSVVEVLWDQYGIGLYMFDELDEDFDPASLLKEII